MNERETKIHLHYLHYTLHYTLFKSSIRKYTGDEGGEKEVDQ